MKAGLKFSDLSYQERMAYIRTQTCFHYYAYPRLTLVPKD